MGKVAGKEEKMSDIQKCYADQRYGRPPTCKRAPFCRRHTEKAGPHCQAYGQPTPDYTPENGCSMFLDNGEIWARIAMGEYNQ